MALRSSLDGACILAHPCRSPGLPTITPTSDLTVVLFFTTLAVRRQTDSLHSVPFHGFVSCTEKLSGELVKATSDPKRQAHNTYGFSPFGAENIAAQKLMCAASHGQQPRDPDVFHPLSYWRCLTSKEKEAPPASVAAGGRDLSVGIYFQGRTPGPRGIQNRPLLLAARQGD